MDAVSKDPSPPGRPSLLLGVLHLGALWALAFAQPLFDLLGDNPEFFVARGNTGGQILAYSLIFLLVPPLVALALEGAAQLARPDLRWGVHLGLFGLLAACIALQFLKRLDSWPAWLMIALAVLLGAGAAYAYATRRFPQVLMDVLTPAPLIVLALFLFASDTSRLILPQEDPEPIEARVGNPVPVVMVVFDEFPEGSIMTPEGEVDGSRFPAFAELERHSTWYRNATGSASFTSLAVPAILTGEIPGQEDLPIAADHPESLFTLLGGRYDMHVKEVSTQICPESICPDPDLGELGGASLGDLFSDLEVVSRRLLLPESMTDGLPDIGNTFGEFTAETDEGVGTDDLAPARTGQGGARELARALGARDQTDEEERVAEFNREMADRGGRTLDFIHIEKPHYPWRHLPNGRRYTNLTSEWAPVLPNDGPWTTSRRVTDIALQRHLLEAGWTDTLLGRIVGGLKRSGLWDRAMVVVAADHGGAFIRQQPRREPTRQNLGEIAMVPLFVKFPGQRRGKVVDRHVCNTDVLPMVAAELEVLVPWETDTCEPGTVTVINSPEGEASAPFEDVVAQRDRYVERIERLFGTGDGWAPVYRLGPHQELIGRRVAKLETLPLGFKQRAYPERQNLIEDFDPRTLAPLGLLQRGELEDIRRDRPLAIAINGTIRSVGWSFKNGEGGGYRYSILLPPGSLRKGDNRMAIYLVKEVRGEPVLKAIYDPTQNDEVAERAEAARAAEEAAAAAAEAAEAAEDEDGS